MLVQDLMKKDVQSCSTNTSLRQCAEMMRRFEIGFVPVVGEGSRIVGVVTDRDLTIRALAEGLSSDTPISKVMSTQLCACRPYHDLSKAEDILSNAQKSRLLVLDDGGRCVGVLSLSDIAQHEAPSRAGEILSAVTEREAHPD